MTTEMQLIRRAVAGDQSAYTELYDTHRRFVIQALLGFRRQYEIQNDEIDDMMQETFVNAFKALPRFNGEAKFRTWLFVIARNVFRMGARKGNVEKRQGRHHLVSIESMKELSSMNEADGLFPEELTSDMSMEGTVDRLVLQRALDNLPPGCRGVFIAHEIQGYKHCEIAKMFDHTIGNSKSQLHKAKQHMRRLLTPKYKIKNNPTQMRTPRSMS